MKYTSEILQAAASKSTSIKCLLRNLGCHSYSGSMHNHIKRQLSLFGIDTAHFLGRKSALGKPSKNRKATEQILESGYTQRANTMQLRRALLNSGIAYCCAGCGILPEWQGKSLLLQIDHINGDWSNNLKDNLRFLCPNCHSQTSTFGGSKTTQVVVKPCRCGKMIQITSKTHVPVETGARCRSCIGLANLKKSVSGHKEKISWPNTVQLKKLIWAKPMVQIAKELGISDKAIKKRCNKLGISTPGRGYWQKLLRINKA
jgi:hypothetical protein